MCNVSNQSAPASMLQIRASPCACQLVATQYLLLHLPPRPPSQESTHAHNMYNQAGKFETCSFEKAWRSNFFFSFKAAASTGSSTFFTTFFRDFFFLNASQTKNDPHTESSSFPLGTDATSPAKCWQCSVEREQERERERALRMGARAS